MLFRSPGFAVAAYAALRHDPAASETALRWELVGHLCRCNAYDKIVVAARDAGRRMRNEPMTSFSPSGQGLHEG